MIDTPHNCFVRAEFSRAEAAGATLDHMRRRHLAAADAWDDLARILQAPVEHDIDAPFMRIEAFVRTDAPRPDQAVGASA